jgi:hypothetical protein
VKRVIAGPDNWPAKSSGIKQRWIHQILLLSLSLSKKMELKEKGVGSTEYSGARRARERGLR